ncbi:MAG: WecB/TagA/CpsF family glycosyltransferase [Acidobacteriota bacterium]
MRAKLASWWEWVPAPPVETEPLSRRRKLIMIGAIFALACLIRYLHHLDLMPLIKAGQQDFAGITAIHDGTANDILNKGIEAIFPTNWPNRSDTSLLHYPPGYPLLLSIIYSINGRDPAAVQYLQMLLDALAAVLVFLITLEFANRRVALIAGLAVAVSHHLAYYSMLLLPDGLVPVCIMAGTLYLIRGFKIGWKLGKGYRELAAAGFFYGLSCWFRTNAWLLCVFWIITFLILRKQIVQPLRRALTVALVMFAVIAPITIRNYYIYDELVLVGLGSGLALQEGLGEADTSLGFPAKDDETMRWEAKLYQKPDYANDLSTPDGIFREQERVRRSVKVIIDRPFWYLGVMAERINLMMKYSAHAPLIRVDVAPEGGPTVLLKTYQQEHGTIRGMLHYYIDNGTAIDYLRPLLRALQRVFKESLLLLVILGMIIGLKDLRCWLLWMTVPLYFLLVHSAAHTEFRYILSAHYLLFIFYGLALHTIFMVLPGRLRGLLCLPSYTAEIGTEPFEHLSPPHPHSSVARSGTSESYEPNALELNEEEKPVRAVVVASVGGAGAASAPLPEVIRQRVTVAGVDVDNISQREAVRLIDHFIAARVPRMMAVVNASKILLATQDEELKRILIGADLVTADGMSVVWASRYLGCPLKERVTGIDTFQQVVALAVRRNYSVYFLGARPEVIQSLVRLYQSKYPSLKIAGYHNGYFGRTEDVVDDIRRAAPDILFVAMGSPRQEKWLFANLHVLNVPFSLGVGGSFDHVAGFVKRAPGWVQNLGLEWLYRFLQEPRRLWRRYLIGNILFLQLILKEKFHRR